MDLKKSHVKKVIKKSFLTKMEDQGFRQIPKSLGCFRVKGDFVEVLTIHIGRSAGSLYLHYFMNLLSDPIANTLETYRVGDRLQRSPATDALWLAETDDELEIVVDSIIEAVDDVALPFFNTINNYKDYAVEIISDVNNRTFSFDLAICLAGLHKYNKVFWLCEDNINVLNSNDDYDDYERKEIQKYMKGLRNASQSHQKDQVDSLLKMWKDTKLEII